MSSEQSNVAAQLAVLYAAAEEHWPGAGIFLKVLRDAKNKAASDPLGTPTGRRLKAVVVANQVASQVKLPGGAKPAKIGFGYLLSRCGDQMSNPRSECEQAVKWSVRQGVHRTRDRVILKKRQAGHRLATRGTLNRNRSKGCAGTRTRGSRRTTARNTGPPGNSDGDSSDGEPASRFRPELNRLATTWAARRG